MPDPITWPTSPAIGDIYTSPNGDVWVYDGCKWISTCCPPCPPGELAFNFFYGGSEGVETLCIPLEPNPFPWPENSYIIRQGAETIILSYVNGCWQFTSVVEGTTLLVATHCSPAVTGNYTVLAAEAESFAAQVVCETCTAICVEITEGEGETTQVTVFPYTNPSGDVGYVSLRRDYDILWNGIAWELVGVSTIGTLTGVPSTSLPVGGSTDWEPVDPLVEIVTTSEACPCDPTLAGLTLVLITNAGNTLVLPFTWDGSDYVLSGEPDIVIELNGSTWELRENGSLVATATDPLGTWTLESTTELDSIIAYCGLQPFTYGCICSPENVCYDIHRVTDALGNVVYIPTDGTDIVIEFNSTTGVWDVVEAGLVVDSIIGSSLGPWGSGSSWSATPNSLGCDDI